MGISEFHLPRPDLKGAVKSIWKNKQRWGLFGALVVGNAIAGGIAQDALARLNTAEKNIDAMTSVTGLLIAKDVEKTIDICMADAHAAYVGGYPITYEEALQACDARAGRELEYWRSVLSQKKSKGDFE